MKPKTKRINKNNDKSFKNKNNKKDHKIQLINNQQQDQNQNNNELTKGQPILKNLSDFVTAITPVYVSKPIYTGGRILSGQHKIYASCNNQIVIYDIQTQTILQKIKHKNQQIVNFCIDPFQKNIITFSSNNLLRLINIQTQKIIHKIKLNPKLFIIDMSYSLDGKFLAIGFANSIIKIYSISTEAIKQTHSYKNHNLPVRKLEWHRNTQTLQVISIDQDKNLIVFDYILNKVIAHVKNAGKNFVQTTKGTSLIISNDKQIKLYDYKTFKVQNSVQLEEYIDALLYLDNGMLVFGGQETRVFNVDLNNHQLQVRNDVYTADNGVLKILCISNNKQFLVVSAQQNLTIVDSKKLTYIDTIIGFNDQIIDIKYSKSSRKSKNQSQFVIMITNSNNAKIFNRQTLKLVSFITGHEDTILCCQYFHPYVVTAGKDKVIKLHQIDPLGRTKLLANYHGHSQYICGLAIMIDSKLIISASQDKTLKLWPIVQQRQHKIQIKNAISTISAHPKSINAVRSSPNQDFIATCSHDRTAKIWGPNLQLYFTLNGHKRGVWDAAFHPIQKLVVTVAGDGSLKGWSLFNGQCLWSLGQGFAIMRCQWIYHHQVVTSSIDGIVKIWDIRKQTSLSYDKHQGKIWALQVIKDQKNNNKVQLFTGANDSTFYVWKDTTQQTRQKIMKSHELQQQQRIEYDQLIYQGKYLQAAKLAFENNYTQLFINTINQVFNQIDLKNEEVQVKFQDGKLMIQQSQQNKRQRELPSEAQLKQFMKQLFHIDNNRLLNILYVMTSTVRNYKSAQTIFLSLLKSIPLNRIIQLEKQFSLVHRKQNDLEDLNSKKSQFQQFLEKMQIYTQKHLNRIQRYIKGTYYMDHLKQKESII